MDKILEQIAREAAADDAKLKADEDAKYQIWQESEKPEQNYLAAVKARKAKADMHAKRRDDREGELLAKFTPVIQPLRDDICDEWQKAKRFDFRDADFDGYKRAGLLMALRDECNSAHLDYDTPQAAYSALNAKFASIPRVGEVQERDSKKISRGGTFLVGS